MNGYYYHILPTCLVIYTTDMCLRNMIPIAEAKQRFPEVFDVVSDQNRLQKLFSDLKI